MIIAFSGYAQSGKDTAANLLVEEYGFKKLAFADALRDFALAVNPILSTANPNKPYRYADAIRDVGYEQAKKNWKEVRELLQRIGTEAGRKIISDNVWVDATFNKMQPGENYVLSDARFPNEAEATEKSGGLVVRIERPGTAPVNNHPSETSLDDWKFDWVLRNDGTQEEFLENLRFYFDYLGISKP